MLMLIMSLLMLMIDFGCFSFSLVVRYYLSFYHCIFVNESSRDWVESSGAILMATLCPPGSEGASYAMFTTGFNSALLLAPFVSTTLLGIWDVSKEALEAGHLDGLFNLSVLTTAFQMSPILILFWLPQGRDELYALAKKPYSGSPIGGGIFLTILFGSMSYTFIVAILNIVDPGWAGESR
jgi:hypothetical protein